MAALLTTQYPELQVGEPARAYERTIADHVLLQGRLADGGALSAQVAGGRPVDDTPFRMEVVGEDGVLTLHGGAPRGFQAGPLDLNVDGEPVEVDAGDTAGLPDSVINVAGVYAALRDDIANDTSTAPNFEHAVLLSHLVDDLLAAAAAARSIGPTNDWPAS